MSNDEEVKAELERLKREKVITEKTAQLYLKDYSKRLQKDSDDSNPKS